MFLLPSYNLFVLGYTTIVDGEAIGRGRANGAGRGENKKTLSMCNHLTSRGPIYKNKKIKKMCPLKDKFYSPQLQFVGKLKLELK